MKQIYHFTRTAGKQQSLKAGVALLLMGVMLTLLPAALQAQPIKNFTQRTSNYSPDMPIYHIKGDYTMIGNTNVTFSGSYSNTSNNSSAMKYVDVDGNTFPTINSSTAALTFSKEFGANPACSEVVYAGLYWTGRDNDNTMVRTITEGVYSNPQTLNNGDEIGDYTLTITQSGNNTRIFTFTNTNGSESVVLTMQRNSYYGYYTVSNGGAQIYSGDETASSLYITLPGTNYAITDLSWNSSAIVREVVTPAYIVSRNRIKIKHANAPEYTEMEATLDDIYYSGQNGMADYEDFYAAYVEVTDYVRQYGLGNYTVADLETHVGSSNSTGWIGGWCMVVVYENSKMKWRDITLFDGFARVTNATNASTVNIPISGFKTVQVGDINMKLGMMAAEGDAGIDGDGCKIKIRNTEQYSPLPHDGETIEGAFFNSSIQTGGNYRSPNYVNNTGIDIITLNITSDPNDPNAILYNEQTSTTFQFTSDQDLYFPFLFVMGVDAYIPEAEALSGVMNIDEDDIAIDLETGNYLIEPGKEITFKVEVKNFGTEDIVDAKLEIPLPSTIEYYYTEVEYVHPGINIEGYYDAERYANGVAGWNIDYIPSGDPNQVYARVLLTVKVTEDCYVLASTDPECELAIEVNGTLEGTSYVNRVYFKKESFISGFADKTGCQGNAIRNDIKVVVNKASYVNDNCQGRDYTVRLVNVCGNAFNAANPIPFMDIYALYPQGSRFFNATTGVEYTAATGFPISLAGINSASAKLIHVQPTSIYSAACTSDLRFILDPNGDSFTTTPTLRDSTYCLDALADSLSKHIDTTSTPDDVYYRFYKERSNSAVAYVDIVPPTDMEGTYTYYVRQFRKNTIGCEDDNFYGPITIKVVSPITFSSSRVSPSCIGDTVRITGIPEGGRWSWPGTLTGIDTLGNVLTINGNFAGTYTVTYTHNNPGTADYNCDNTVRSYTHQIAATTYPGDLQSDQTICQGAQIQPLQIVDHSGHIERWEWTTDTTSSNWDTIPNNTSSISSADLGELAVGTYYFRALVKDGNCRAEWTDTVTIEVTNQTAPPPPTVTSPQYACIGTEYTIRPDSINYQWYEQAIGGWPIGGDNPVHSVTVPITDAWITRYVSKVDPVTRCVSNRVEVQVRPNLEPGAIATTGQRECDLRQTATTIGSNIDAVAYGEEGTVKYQWYVQVNGDTTLREISGANSATYTPSTSDMGTEGEYIFIRKVKNSTCDKWQQSRGEWRLVVGKPDASIVADPGHATICQNGGIQLRLRVPASTAYSYQWYKNGIAITTNGTGHEYIATEVGTYTAQVTHRASGCSATTQDEDAIEVGYDNAAPTASNATTTIEGCSIADAQDEPTYSKVADIEKSIADGGLGISISDAITPDSLLTLTLTHTEAETENLPTGVCYQLVRTYTVTDQCGSYTTFTHTINVNQADFTLPANEGSTETCPSATDTPPTLPTVTDACGNALTGVLKEGYPTELTDCEGTVTYVYTFTDCAGHSHDWVYTYTIDRPTLTFSGTINDVENVNACYSESHKSRLLTADQVKAMYSSSCSREITVSTNDVVVSSSDCNWKITRTYNISDGGCNTVTPAPTMSVRGSDRTAPVITCNENLTTTTDDGQPYATVTLPNPTYGDNCSATYRISYGPATPTNATVTNANGQYPLGKTTVTYSVEDGCGNVDSCSFTVTVTDDENPEISCPELSVDNYSVTTDDGVDTYTHQGIGWNATATDNDSIRSLTYVLSGVTTGSGSSLANQVFNMGTTTVTWIVVDNSGLTDTCSYTVTVTDDEDPVISCPSNIAGIACITDVPAAYTDYAAFQAAGGEATDNDVVDYESFALVDADTNGICPTTITRTYYIEDTTGNRATCEQVITIKDSIAPVLAGTWPSDSTGQDNCFANRNISGLMSNDAVKALYSDCNTFTVSHEDTVTGNNCGWTVTRTYTITDLCENTVMPKPTMSVSGSDQTAPYIMPTVLDRTLTATGCEFRIPDMREEVRAISSDGCTGNSALTVEQPSAGMQVYPQVIARDTNVIIRVTDACGNYSLKSVKITIPAKVVITATATPASICNGETAQLSTTVANVVGAASYVWEPTTGLNSTTIYNPTTTLTATDAPETVTYTVKVTDANGCTATATTFVTVNPEVVIYALADTVINSGTTVPAKFFTTPLTGGVMTYSWTRTNADVVTGMDATGIGNVPGATLYNNTNTAKTTTITVTPTFTANGISCVGATVSYTITVNPTVVMEEVENQVICHGSEIEPVTFGTTITDATSFVYNWVRTNTANVTGLAETSSGNIDATALYNETDQVQVTTFTVTPTYTNNGISSTGTPITFDVTVYPEVVMNTVAAQTICHNTAITPITFGTSITDGTMSYAWTRTNTENITPWAGSGNGNIGAEVLSNTTGTYQITEVSVTPTYTNNGKSCVGAVQNFTITVNPKVVMNTPDNIFVCHNESIEDINFSSNLTGGTMSYAWTSSNSSVGGVATSGTVKVPAATLTNTTTTAQTTTITVTPTYTANDISCVGAQITFTITVNPEVVMNTPANIFVCHNESIEDINFSSNLTGGTMSYAWTSSNSSVGGVATSGTVKVPAATLTNTTTTAQTTTITVTPTYTANGISCEGAPITFTITVNPEVGMDTPDNQAICHGSAITAVNFTTPITDGSVDYNWSRDNDNIGGLAMSGTGNIAAATLTNTTNTAQTTTITVTPVYANNGKTCTDETITFTITVYPKVVMDTVADQAICHGSAITAVNFSSDLSGGDITYTWRRTNSNIGGLDMSDTGNIPATVLTNTTNTVQVDTITVTPVYTNNGNECTDETITFTITVNPKVVMNDVVDQAICHGSEMAAVNFSSDLTGGDITYTWRRTNSNVVGLAMSGIGNIPATVLTNTTNTAQVDTIYVKPTYEANSNVCDDDSVFFTITVNPKVVMDTVANQAICHGSAITAVNFTTPITDGSVVYNWSRNNDNIAGLAMSGAGNIPDTVLTNTTNTAQVDTITVTPVYTNNGNECTDESITFTITVNPKVVMNDVVDQAICHGSAITAVNFTTPITDGSVVYNWSRDNDSISGLAMSGTGNIPATVLTNTTNTAQVDTITVTPVYANNGNECTDETITFTITVNPKVVMNDVLDQAICHGSEMAAVNFTTPITDGSVVYNWSRNNENIEGLDMSGTGNIAAATLTNTTNTAQTTTITVTPVYTNNGNECTDESITFTITVNPEVVMNTVEDWTLCVGETSQEYVYTSTITDGTVTYGWRNDNSAIGLAASGTGNLPSFEAANSTSADLIAEVKVAPTYANNGISCQGDSINFHITVRPSITTPGNVAFSCPADTTVVLSYSECEQFVNIGYPEFVNNMIGMTVNITNDAPEGNIFPEGTTIVTWTATDECGAFLTCTQNVVVQFPSCGDSIADFDGYRYSSVRIGCQCWTGENARSEHYSDGTPVDNFRYYNDSDSLENIYGKLYTWYTAVRVPEGDDAAVPADSIDPLGNSYVQGICPEGWALPTVDEYMLMIANSGDATHAKDGSNLYWLPGYEGQPPFSGFDAYGAGKYNGAIDRYQDLLGKTYFWTTLSGSGSETATTVEINYYCAEGLQTELSKGDGVSIRCIRKR